MRRRKFIALLGSTVVAWPLAARAQHQQVRRIGVLLNRSADDGQTRLAAFLQGLQESGWVVGRNVRIDIRYGAGDPELTRRHAAELSALAPDVILAPTTATVRALLHQPHHTDRIRDGDRSGGRRPRRQLGAPGRQRNWIRQR
jgi:putative tryptophan/tyrosine transport system substrate-binding protein